MFPEERRASIQAMIDEVGRVTVSDVAQRLGITEDLVRRDLKQLADEGRCQRVWGGATRVENVSERAMSARLTREAPEKLAIARKALALLAPGQTVYLDMSSTCVHLAGLIRDAGLELTVVTPMVDVLATLMDAERVTTLCCGGTLRPQMRGLLGSLATETLSHFRFDVALMGAYGVDAETGEVSTFDGEDGLLKQCAMGRASKTYLLCESRKFSAFGSWRYADLPDFDALVTDGANEWACERVRALGCDVL